MPANSWTPIHVLNTDILLSIFTMNADIFSDRHAIHTTRITSQVCRQWRDLMLDTPSLWARLLDMEALYYISAHEWWNELIRRSRDAPLWIRAYSALHANRTDRSKHLRQLFIDIIHGNWHRIQKLYIDDHYSGFGLSLAMLCFPAPQLEDSDGFLPKKTAHAENHDQKREITPIFAGHAPMLRTSRFRGHTIADQHAPWLRNLCSIELDCEYGLRDALAVLSAASRLQDLKAYGIVEGYVSRPLPTVSLPHLKYFQYHGFPQPCATLLDHTIIPLGCSLTIQIVGYNIRELAQEIQRKLISVFNIFTDYVERYLQANIFNAIHICYWSNCSISVGMQNCVSGRMPAQFVPSAAQHFTFKSG
ncbi:hypothetical protein HYPSUDRAFT_465806 [Hypholoma sublateritium FD-334 SS-4]|uniref:Uncharacterized protein n=1 Tax=Hypholoma sublateritium (strain FD-334 SS-4) TaxID=945553 RepID=A0A0D2PZM8_HYPSF|nr:hypothetical protein HYPSUDRAFT_465806 [Hypholoma sublateritium FD-334 SS-4]